MTVRTRVVGLCLESVDATALTAVSDMTKAKTILQEGHALQEKITQKVWRRAGFFSPHFLHKDLNQNDHGDDIDLVHRKNTNPTRREFVGPNKTSLVVNHKFTPPLLFEDGEKALPFSIGRIDQQNLD